MDVIYLNLSTKFHVALIDSWQPCAQCVYIEYIHSNVGLMHKQTAQGDYLRQESVTSSFRLTQTYTFSYTEMLLHRHADTCQGEKPYERQTEVRKCSKTPQVSFLINLVLKLKSVSRGHSRHTHTRSHARPQAHTPTRIKWQREVRL